MIPSEGVEQLLHQRSPILQGWGENSCLQPAAFSLFSRIGVSHMEPCCMLGSSGQSWAGRKFPGEHSWNQHLCGVDCGKEEGALRVVCTGSLGAWSTPEPASFHAASLIPLCSLRQCISLRGKASESQRTRWCCSRPATVRGWGKPLHPRGDLGHRTPKHPPQPSSVASE